MSRSRSVRRGTRLEALRAQPWLIALNDATASRLCPARAAAARAGGHQAGRRGRHPPARWPGWRPPVDHAHMSLAPIGREAAALVGRRARARRSPTPPCCCHDVDGPWLDPACGSGGVRRRAPPLHIPFSASGAASSHSPKKHLSPTWQVPGPMIPLRALRCPTHLLLWRSRHGSHASSTAFCGNYLAYLHRVALGTTTLWRCLL